MMRIAVVGNAPLSFSTARRISGHDLVIWFNRAKEFGFASDRIDVLVLGFAKLLEEQSTNYAAYDAAREIWILSRGVPNLAKPVRRVATPEWLIGTLVAMGARGRVRPSSGACVIAYLLETYPEAKISLIGFNHTGSERHSWDAERRWCDCLVEAGKAQRIANVDSWPMHLYAVFVRSARRVARNLRMLLRKKRAVDAEATRYGG